MGRIELAAIAVASAVVLMIPVAKVHAEKLEPAAAEMERLAADLDAAEFATRQAASQRLGELGQSAFPVLEKVAQSDSREASMRAIDVLKKHFGGGDDAARSAAKESLERIAKSGQPSIARRASEVLSPPKPVAVAVPANRRVLRPANAQIQLRLNPGIIPGNVRRIHTRTVNGVKEVNAEENGRKVKIVVDPAKGIEVEVSETKDGKTTSKKYTAKDAGELKKNHPEAHQLYEQYGKDGDGIRIQGGFRIAPGAVPGQILPGQILPNAFPRPAAPPVAKAEMLKRIDDMIRSMDNNIEKYRQRADNNDTYRRAIESLENSKRRLQESRARMAER